MSAYFGNSRVPETGTCTNTRRVKDIEIGLQLWMTLVGPMYQTSDCLETLCISTVDLTLNIDMVRSLGTTVLKLMTASYVVLRP
eukprot:COSAG02_NODE_13569_length_1377_cov_8.018293_1_plen_84_part_00